MHSEAFYSNPRETLWISRRAVCLALLTFAAGCSPLRHAEGTASTDDLTLDGQHTSGAWTYTYSVTNPGTRSEGYHGVLTYRDSEVPAPMHINDFYETPWGRLYWAGKPLVLFGRHGWMRTPVGREPAGKALIDPAIVHSDRFMVHIKLVASEELATPDRLERDSRVLEALKPFGLAEVHVQGNWCPVGADPITLHDTKRWGTLKVCRADTNQTHAPTLEFNSTNELTVGTSPKPATLDEIMAVPEFPLKGTQVSLCPQADTLQPIKCTVSSIVGDPLVLYLVCRIQDQGPKPPWKVPGIRNYEPDPSQSPTVR